MIQHVTLKSFKGFRNYRINLHRFTNLVGLNSRGKTSILQGIKFANDLLRMSFRDGQTSDFTNVQWQFGPGEVLARYSQNDPVALWFGKVISSPCCVALDLQDGITLEAKVNGLNQCQLDVFVDRKAIRTHALNPPELRRAQLALQTFFADNALYVPPLGATSGIENWTNFENFQRELQRGRHTETWRNSLYWLYNDGDKEKYKHVVELVNRYLPESVILPPRLNHDNPPSVVIEFLEGGEKYDIGLSGAGLRSLLNLGSVLLLSNSKLILLDEPDAHLHSDLQRIVARMLVDFSLERGIQIITASHAPDFIAETPLDTVYWVDRTQTEGRPVDTLARVLVDLGSITNTDAISVGSANAVLFVEGVIDRRILSAAFDACGLENPVSNPKVVIAKLPNGKSSSEGVQMLPPLLKGLAGKPIRVVCLLDNDWELLSGGTESNSSELAICLRRKEIENYVIDPAVFARAAAKSAELRNINTESSITPPDATQIAAKLNEICESLKESVRCQLIWRYRDGLPKELDRATRESRATAWFDSCWSTLDWKLNAIPGKQVLATLRRWCQESFSLTITDKILIESLHPVPEDLKQTLSAIVRILNLSK